MKSSSFTITDIITNYSFKSENLRIMYHINFGFPLLSPSTEIILPKLETIPRDEIAKKGLDHFLKIQPPKQNFDEQVYLHKIIDSGINYFSVKNETIGTAVTCQLNSTQLPYLTQWNQFGKNEYVLGLEPGSDWPLTEHQNNLILEPLESFSTSLKFSFSQI